MNKSKLFYFAPAFALALLLYVPCVTAQDAPPPPPPGAPAGPNGGGPGGPGGSGPGQDRMQQFRQRMTERLKTALKASDEEMGVIAPLIEKVFTKQREAMGGRGFGFGGRRSGGGPSATGTPGAPGAPGANGAPQGPRPGDSPAADALQKALDAEGTSTAEIKAKLDAVREARKKALAELEQARADLSKVLTQRQEATLVLMGVLQ